MSTPPPSPAHLSISSGFTAFYKFLWASQTSPPRKQSFVPLFLTRRDTLVKQAFSDYYRPDGGSI